MQTATNDDTGRDRWTLRIVLTALLSAGAVFAVFAIAGRPLEGLGLSVPVASLSASLVGDLRGRATRHSTDERARDIDLRARSFAFAVIGLALIGMWGGPTPGAAPSPPSPTSTC